VGLIGLVTVNIVQPGELYPIFDTLHVERLAGIFVLGTLLLHRGRINVKGPMSRPVLFFWLALFASVPLAYWRGNSLWGAIGFYKHIVYFFLIVNLVTTARRLKIFIAACVALNGWLAISSYWAYSHGFYYGSEALERAEGLTSSAGDPNSLGITLVCGIPLAVLLIFYGNARLRILGLVAAGASLVTLVLTGSRTAFLGFIVLTFVFALTRRKKFLILPVAAIIACAVFFLAPPDYQQRYLSVQNRDQDESYMNRVHAWHAGLAMMEHNPLTGVGMLNFAEADGGKYWPLPGRKHWLQAHSLYVQTGAELGVVGVAAFAWFLFSIFKLNREIKKASQRFDHWPKWLKYYPTACNFSLFVLLFTGYAAHSLYRSTWFLLAAMTSCAYSVVSESLAAEKQAKPDRVLVRRDVWSTAPSEVGP
jgi:O-antigen ligase